MAPGAIPTVPEYLKKWLVSDEDYIKNCSQELSQHGMNYIVPFKAQCSVPLISVFMTRNGQLHTIEDNEKAHARKVLRDLFQKLQAEFPPLPPDSLMKILPENRGNADSNEDGGDGVILVSNDGSEESGAK